ncbi:MAG: hypothetical protein GY869_30705, partial [Planctomycetes bacterium]|nr:hypothetical protein [Planctomycetota bacterium]
SRFHICYVTAASRIDEILTQPSHSPEYEAEIPPQALGATIGYYFTGYDAYWETDFLIPVGAPQYGFFEFAIVEPVSGGILVWEGVGDGQDYSGAYIRDYLQSRNFEVTYTTAFPPLLIGYDAVFLSFGIVGSNETRLYDNPNMVPAIESYLHSGGRLYLEGGDPLGYDLPDVIGSTSLWPLFGLADAEDGSQNKPPLQSLLGQESTLTAGISFFGSTQSSYTWIDQFFPDDSGIAAFIEPDYATV